MNSKSKTCIEYFDIKQFLEIKSQRPCGVDSVSLFALSQPKGKKS